MDINNFGNYSPPQLASEEECTGCTACISVCPKNCIMMEKDLYGFLRPVINVKACNHCGLCQKSCPIINNVQQKPNKNQVYAAYSKDDGIRLASSSGGLFTEIAKTILDQHGIVWGASYDDSFIVRHIPINSYSEIYRLQGAKYSQSVLAGVFPQIKKQLLEEIPVLFCGTPCQVYGLKNYLGKNYDNLLCIDFVCHSIPSPLAWEKYLGYRALKDNDGSMPISINMRSKVSGWSHYEYSVVINYGNKQYLRKSDQDLYLQLFVKGYISRSSCYRCKFKGFNRISDITLGDCWGVWDFAAQMDDNRGTSLIIVHSDKGNSVLSAILKKISLVAISHEDAIKENKAISFSPSPCSNREFILRKAVSGDYDDLYKMINNKSFMQSIKGKIKHALSFLEVK